MKRVEEILRNFDDLLENIHILDDEKIIENIKMLSKEAEENALFEVHIALLNITDNFNRERVINLLKEAKKLIERYFLKDDEFLLVTLNSDEFEPLIKGLMKEGFKVSIKDYDFDIAEYIYLRRPDVVLIDNDSKNHGLFTVKILNEEEITRKIPVITFGEKQFAKDFFLLGSIDHIEKPFNFDDVLLKIKNIYGFSNTYIKNNIYDVFTGVYSRYHGDIISKKEFYRVKNDDDSFIYMIIDFDNMAKINFELGKSIGNDILKESAAIFKRLIHEGDIIYRLHGDAFAFMIFNKNILEVVLMADKMQDEIKQLGKKYKVDLSFSAGIAEYNKSIESLDELLELAENSLKKAKHDGGGKIYTSKQLGGQSKKKLLIVDDDKIILSILSKRYTNKGYEVLTASNGEAAIEIFKQNQDVDLIISDFYMPGMTGDEFVKEIRKINKNVKIIVLSAHKSEGHIQKALDAGADEYVTKPFSPVELDIRIKKLIK